MPSSRLSRFPSLPAYTVYYLELLVSSSMWYNESKLLHLQVGTASDTLVT